MHRHTGKCADCDQIVEVFEALRRALLSWSVYHNIGPDGRSVKTHEALYQAAMKQTRGALALANNIRPVAGEEVKP